MNSIVTIVSPFLVSWLSGIIKNHALSDDASKALVRAVVAVLSVVIALGTAWLNGGLPTTFDATLQTAVIAVINFIGATGIFHLVQSTNKG